VGDGRGVYGIGVNTSMEAKACAQGVTDAVGATTYDDELDSFR
jgi:hypothetical protein